MSTSGHVHGHEVHIRALSSHAAACVALGFTTKDSIVCLSSSPFHYATFSFLPKQHLATPWSDVLSSQSVKMKRERGYDLRKGVWCTTYESVRTLQWSYIKIRQHRLHVRLEMPFRCNCHCTYPSNSSRAIHPKPKMYEFMLAVLRDSENYKLKWYFVRWLGTKQTTKGYMMRDDDNSALLALVLTRNIKSTPAFVSISSLLSQTLAVFSKCRHDRPMWFVCLCCFPNAHNALVMCCAAFSRLPNYGQP